MNTLDIFFEPASLFKNLNSRPTWLGPFLVVSLLVIVCTLLMFPVMEHLMLKQLPVGISAEQQAQMLSSLKMSRYIGLLSAPVTLLIKWSIFAFLLYAVTILFSSDFTYRKALAIMAHASIITALDSLIGIAILYLRGLDNIQSPKDLESLVWSLSWLFSAALHPAFRAILDSLTIFSLWYWIVLFLGVRLTTKLSKLEATAIITILWIIQTGFSVLVALITARYSAASV